MKTFCLLIHLVRFEFSTSKEAKCLLNLRFTSRNVCYKQNIAFESFVFKKCYFCLARTLTLPVHLVLTPSFQRSPSSSFILFCFLCVFFLLFSVLCSVCLFSFRGVCSPIVDFLFTVLIMVPLISLSFKFVWGRVAQ